MTDGPLRVGLLMCGHVDPRAQHLGGDYPSLFADLFAAHPVELVRYDADLGRLPASLDDCDGWITSPSRSSAIGGEPWVADMLDLVARVVAEERPFAGICFGHQLLAEACGGRVERAAVGWGVGNKAYDVVAERPWMTPAAPGGRLHLIASHEDQVTVMPPGAELLATAGYCPIAMMAVGERAFGLQPHPEFTAPLSAALLDLREEMIGQPTVDDARATLAQPLDQALVADWIVRFLSA
jgi:GMP synthase-like glutamine amidotransferase